MVTRFVTVKRRPRGRVGRGGQGSGVSRSSCTPGQNEDWNNCARFIRDHVWSRWLRTASVPRVASAWFSPSRQPIS